MRRALVSGATCGLLALVFAVTGCGPKGTPRMVFSTDDIDMGEISNLEPTTVTATISNEGDGKLKLTHVIRSCSCIAGRVDKAKIAPGESTTLHITMDPFLINGFRSQKYILVRGTDPVNKFVKLPVRCTIKPEFTLGTERLELGALQKGEGAEFEMVLRQVREEPVELKAVELSRQVPHGVSVSFEPRPEDERADPSKAEYTIRLKVAPETRVGRLNGFLKILTNVKRLEKGYRLPMVGAVESFYTIRPVSAVSILGYAPGMRRPGVLFVSSESPIEVTDVAFSSPGVTVTPRRVNDTTIAFDMAVDEAASKDPKGTLSFVVRSGDKVQDEAIVFLGRRSAETSDDDHDQDEELIEEEV
ncbi:MAG: DUF1573 domain-containing protein [bacterium]|nr:DUF1573 domain-containing protein [bacterium]